MSTRPQRSKAKRGLVDIKCVMCRSERRGAAACPPFGGFRKNKEVRFFAGVEAKRARGKLCVGSEACAGAGLEAKRARGENLETIFVVIGKWMWTFYPRYT